MYSFIKEGSSYFFASFEQNNVYTLQADTLRKVVQAAGIRSAEWA